jgi:ATP phosphoribosyltransferase
MLRLALPNKGRLSDDSRSLLADAGLGVRTVADRALIASLGGEFEAIFVRAADIPELVADGAADAGITGWDLVEESGRALQSRLDLRFGRCRLVIAARAESGVRSLADLRDGMRVATVFPRIAARYFASRELGVTLVPVSGAVEVAPHLGIADVILDLTSSGSTLRVNGLTEIATVLESSARLVIPERPREPDEGILRRVPRTARDCAMDELEIALDSVIAARGQRYVMANVPRNRLDEVRAILPGISGPTVIDVMNGGTKVAVHAVAPAEGIFRTLNALRAIGAEGILVTRIERLLA